MPRTERDSAITNVALKFESSLTMKRRGKKMDALGIEPNTSRKPCYMLSERDNQLHHVPCVTFVFACIHICFMRWLSLPWSGPAEKCDAVIIFQGHMV